MIPVLVFGVEFAFLWFIYFGSHLLVALNWLINLGRDFVGDNNYCMSLRNCDLILMEGNTGQTDLYV